MRRTLALAGLCLLLGACGLPQDDQPRELSADDLPADLLGSTTTAPLDPGPGIVNAELYFLRGDRLAVVEREVASSTAEAVLSALLAGVVPEDGDVRSDIPTGTTLVEARRNERVLVISLSAEIGNLQGPARKNAFAQLVFTASQLRDVFGIQFVVDGQFVSVPTDSGDSDQPVFPIDFDSLKPEN